MAMQRFLAAAMAAMISVSAASALADEKKEEHIPYASVPEKVRTAFEKDYPGVTVKEVEKETYPDGTVHYEFEFKKDGQEVEVEYNVDGEKLDPHEEKKASSDKKKDEHKH